MKKLILPVLLGLAAGFLAPAQDLLEQFLP